MSCRRRAFRHGWSGTTTATRAWVGAMDFPRRPRRPALPAGPGRARSPARCSAGARAEARARDRFHLARAADRLPPGRYALAADGVALDAGARGARLAARRLPLPPLPQGQGAGGRARLSRGGRLRPRHRHRRGGGLRPAPDRHARPRHGARGARAAFVALGAAHGAAVTVIRGATALAPREPADDRGGRRRRQRGAAAARPRLGPRGRAQGHARRQGRLLRHRRARHQAGRRRWA